MAVVDNGFGVVDNENFLVVGFIDDDDDDGIVLVVVVVVDVGKIVDTLLLLGISGSIVGNLRFSGSLQHVPTKYELKQ